MSLKVINWNVNSIRKGVSDTLLELLNAQDPDIICFQETRCTQQDGEIFYNNTGLGDKYPFRYWNNSVKGHYGVSVWSKIEPLDIEYEIPDIGSLNEGRILILEFENMTLLNTYVPNTGTGEVAESKRSTWDIMLYKWLTNKLKSFEDNKLLLWCGDLNVVDDPVLDTSHQKYRCKDNKNNSAGLKWFEKKGFDLHISLGLYDVFRTLNPTTISHTWYSSRNPAVSWRLDYFMVNKIETVKTIIHGPKLPSLVSDHTWLMIVVDRG